MVYNLIGKEAVNYKSKKTGNDVAGIKLHCTKDSKSEKVEGKEVEALWISNTSDVYEAATKLPLNSNVNIMYNRYGMIESIELHK